MLWMLCFAGSISDFFLLATKILPRWLFADAEIRHWNASAAGLDLLQLSARRFLVYPLPPFGDYQKEPHKRANSSAVLFQMPRHHCKTYRTPLHADDGHAECVSCLGNPSRCCSVGLPALIARVSVSPLWARGQLSFLLYGRNGRAIRPSPVELRLHSLDMPTRRLDKRLRCCTPRKQSLMCLLSSRSALDAEGRVLLVPHGPTLAPVRPTAVIEDKIKRIHFQKESKYTLLPTISFLPLCSQSLELFQPLATWAEA